MGFDGVCQYYIFQYVVFLVDFQFVVVVGVFKVMMYIE